MKGVSIKQLKVMLEYKSTGLFVTDPPALIGEIDHDKIGLSKRLSEELYAWIKQYDATLDWDDPGHSPPTPPAVIGALNSEGVRLTKLVQNEIGSKIHVFYWAVQQ